MKLYVIEDLTPENIRTVRDHLNSMELGGTMPDLFWLPLPKAMLNQTQSEHAECAPHCMALEIDGHMLRLELLVRARNRLRCDCVCYASPELREHMIQYLDDMLAQLGIYV
ncbi:hypothetical protein [Desulfovibrio psychrotolerans]|uniref:Uncharacterized protein n=1 Tax=Desulfovibrio psychrotolerans TaxID=415242 RepID=A0A7J0BQT3_9BACT|nr:hypothetical protein [Desulfovibrio psychrotolerans]GFM35551.1 hypothetical protein DSM19430T_02350 [Desulfovibrio psychrotolerans]